MEQNTPKFRLRLNLFDGIVLIVALAAGAFLLWTALKPQASVDVTPESTATVRYTLRFEHWPEGTGGMVQPDDMLVDSVKNFEIGRVISTQILPNEVQVIDHANRRNVLTVMEGFEDVLVTVEAACTSNAESVTVGGGYVLRVGAMAYVRGEGYMGSGPIVAMEVEEQK